MKLAMRSTVLAGLALVFCAVGAHADSFQLSYSGVGITGSVNLSAFAVTGGYEVTSISGSQTLGGITQAISNILLPTPVVGTYNGVNFALYSIASTPIFSYDDLIMPGNTPALDAFGLVFSAAGMSGDVNICAAGSNPYTLCGTSAAPYWELTSAGAAYAISSLSIVRTPEPSTLLLLSAGLAGLVFLVRRKSLGLLQIQN
jgi:hypothetical protein